MLLFGPHGIGCQQSRTYDKVKVTPGEFETIVIRCAGVCLEKWV
jgi:hypothetical protein